MNKLSKPLVTVIIACYNAEKYIDACLDALCNQTYNNIEIIVCDDASKDESWNVLQKWAKIDTRIIILRNDKNLFAASTRNKCFEQASGDYYAIQDVDDISKPNRIETLVNEILHDEVDFVSSGVDNFENDRNVITSHTYHKAIYPSKYNFLWGVSFFHPATLFTKECIRKVGGYRVAKETRRGQDYDMFMRLYACGFRGKNIKESLYLYRLDAANIKRRDFSSTIDEYIIRKKNYKQLGMRIIGFPFLFKPFLTYLIQLVKYYNK